MKDFIQEFPILSIIIMIVVLLLIFVFIDMVASKSQTFYGIVVDKHYKAEGNSIGTGVGMTGLGQVGTVITNQHEDEEFLIMVKMNDGEIVTVECSIELYYQKSIGNHIECVNDLGRFTNAVWSRRGIR